MKMSQYKVDEDDIFEDIEKIENDEEITIEKVDKILRKKKPEDQTKEEYIKMIQEKTLDYDPTDINVKPDSTHIFIKEEEKKDILAVLFDKKKHLS